MTDNERHKRIVETIALLLIPGVGRGRLIKLTRMFGSVSAVRDATVQQLSSVSGISEAQATTIKSSTDQSEAERIAGQIDRLGWAVLFPSDDEYPTALANINQPPPILFRAGKAIDPEERMIGIVGTRRPTEAGRVFAATLARQLAEQGVVVVSGMADGIDTAAHHGAIDGGGKTIAVWGNSLDIVYPKTNRGLAEKIKQAGCVFSEYFPGTSPDKAFFPERNRIISGLSAGVVVVEAGQRSGALITASHALEQGRTVFAVPGSPGSQMSIGCNQLLKQGATLVTSADDIFADLPSLKGEVLVQRHNARPDLTDVEKQILAHVAGGPMQIDELSRLADLSIPELSQFLLALELKGVVLELSGKRFMLADEYSC